MPGQPGLIQPMTSYLKQLLYTAFLFCAMLQAIVATATSGAVPDTAVQRMSAELSRLTAPELKANKYLDMAKYYVDKPGEDKKDLDNAQTYCTQGLKIATQSGAAQALTRAYTVQAQILRERGNNKDAEGFVNKALAFSNKVKDAQTLAGLYLEKASYYSIDSDTGLAQKIKYYRSAIIYLRQSAPNSMQLADALKYMGDLYGFQGANSAALPLLYESLAIYQANKYEKLQDIYSLIGATLSRLERRREGLKYSLEAVRAAEKFKDSSMTMCDIYNKLAYTYNNLGQNDKAAECMQKAIIYAKHNHQDMAAYVLTSNLAVAYIDLKQFPKALQLAQNALKTIPGDQRIARIVFNVDLVRAYTAMKKYAFAEQYYNRAQTLITGTHQSPIIWDLLYASGIDLYMKLHNYSKVNALIAIYGKITIDAGNLMSLTKAEEFAYKADSAQQNFRDAFLHFQVFKKLNDSLVKRDHDKETAQLQLQFETEKKDEDIAAKAKNIQLLTKQTELQKSALKNQSLVRNLSILAVAMLLVVVAVIYNRYKLKQRANFELEEQREEINTQNEALKQLVHEREWLIKEVHHRVKNNLQIVMSLLNSQSVYIDNASVREVIRESKNRVNSISLIHQKLYQTDDLSGVEMHTYIHELVDNIAESFGTKGRIAFMLSIDHITLDVTQAVPLGLVINEALTNAVKYAFEPGTDAQVSVELRQKNRQVYLRITDNGKGLPAGFDLFNLTSMGMNLMQGLSSQLGGTLEIKNGGGLQLAVAFRMKGPLGSIA